MHAGARVLITGGAGFIGSHLADALLLRGYRVRVLDALTEQVHGGSPSFPTYLAREVETVRGDVRDRDAVLRALEDIDAVFHFAAAVGVGQSMYEIESYTDTNNRGTAVLLEALLRRPVGKLLVASSMSIYGEGLYRAADGRLSSPRPRTLEQLKAGRWDLTDERGQPLEPVPTPESKPAAPESIYALSKHDQEMMCLLFGRCYGVPAVALRFFNVYGERQALSNPYTGVLAIFAARYLNGRPPVIFEDGRQQRDFVHVRDLARGCVLALEKPEARDMVFNLGSGEPHSILEIAERLGAVLGRAHLQPEVRGRYRAGDIRHCFADISRARAMLGYRPEVPLETGLAELGGWLEGQRTEDRTEAADHELRLRGLVA
ncbi:MAG TPA: NAD-dependent epimerase/dehydratase family protein [Steroidobacteraceae bacterium]|nr:NAD-dependent epimerase/dehydratase family protein [Steroidobacteraceae bacterium]